MTGPRTNVEIKLHTISPHKDNVIKINGVDIRCRGLELIADINEATVLRIEVLPDEVDLILEDTLIEVHPVERILEYKRTDGSIGIHGIRNDALTETGFEKFNPLLGDE